VGACSGSEFQRAFDRTSLLGFDQYTKRKTPSAPPAFTPGKCTLNKPGITAPTPAAEIARTTRIANHCWSVGFGILSEISKIKRKRPLNTENTIMFAFWLVTFGSIPANSGCFSSAADRPGGRAGVTVSVTSCVSFLSPDRAVSR